MANEKKDVRRKLLDAAEQLFCQKGFHQTSIRDIVTKADCNIAAVNYHFGGKDKLYLKMLHRFLQNMAEKQTQNINQVMKSEKPELEDLIRIIASTSLEPLKTGRQSVIRIMIRETLDPHKDSEEIIPHEMYRDVEKLFIDSIIKLTPGLETKDAILARFSFDGVVTNAHLFSEFYYKIFPDMDFDILINHIVNFTCAGIRSLVRKQI